MPDDEPGDRPELDAATEWSGGFTWIAYPDEDAQRASHALATDAGVWVVDPVDADGLDDRLDDLGTVAGVLVLQDRHTRDAAAVARRHDVAVAVPDWMDLTREKLDAAPEPLESTVPDTEYALHQLLDTEEWEEAILVDESGGTLLVPEALGTLPPFGETGNDTLGVHPALDEAPEGLAEWTPDRVLVGHGESVHDGATSALEAAVEGE